MKLKQKFIAFKMKVGGKIMEDGTELVFTFPEIVIHSDMKTWCETILHRSNIDQEVGVSSAGFITDDGERYGESETLGINAEGVVKVRRILGY